MDTNENKRGTTVKAPTRPKQKAVAKIIEEKCTGCGICAAVCNTGFIKMVESDWNFNGVAKIDAKCTGCNICAIDCPWDAIVMEYPDGTQKTLADYERQLNKLRGYK
jgi:ferredoxin